MAGLVEDDERGRGMISFLTEGEASLHYCIKSGLSTDAIDVGFRSIFSVLAHLD